MLLAGELNVRVLTLPLELLSLNCITTDLPRVTTVGARLLQLAEGTREEIC